jgi:hypothetical protein
MADWSRPNLEKWVSVLLLSRALGCTASELLGARNCDDCWWDRAKWVRRTVDGRDYYECGKCGRFVGYVR